MRNLQGLLWTLLTAGYCVYLGLSLSALRRNTLNVEEGVEKRRVRAWGLRAGILMPLTFLPMYISEVAKASRQFGFARVLPTALAVALGMLLAGAWTGFWFSLMELRWRRTRGPF
ncbi:MAG: hypothetical protein WBJ62_07510 [Coriobacteriia bacterium]